MNESVKIKTYDAPPIDTREILRYAGCRGCDFATESLLEECLAEVRERLIYRVCYLELPLTLQERECDFGCFTMQSDALSAHLQGCERVLLMGATVGFELDRLIAKYSRISPAKALMLQAIGAERVEALCDRFCEDLGQDGYDLTARFSPGYGDLPLEAQRDVVCLLQADRRIGIYLNESLLMTPTKSVTAIIGIKQ